MRVLHVLANRPKALAAAMVMNLLGCAVVYHALEGTDVITAAWMALVTGTTTGYGDVFPKTLPGRLLVAYLMVSMWVLDRLASAQFVARLIADPDCFTHDEQEELLADADDARAAALRVEELVTTLGSQVEALRTDIATLLPQHDPTLP